MTLRFDNARMAALFESQDGPVAKSLKRRGIRVQREAIKSLHQTGTGRQYGRHQASAPGQPPATDTGRLAASIREELRQDGKGLVEVVGTNVVYARPLERGTRSMAPRPFLRRALAKTRQGRT
jgi:HK97 gp10 family phage protein